MRAHLGDQLVIESPATGGTGRDGEAVGLHHEDGTPPYDVRWSDTDEVTLVFPGPDAHIRHVEHGQPGTTRGSSQRDAGEAEAVSAVAPPAGTPRPGDIGRRVAVERRRHGLSREETARRARIPPGYLAYLEEQPADPTVATLLGLAAALGTTATALRGAGVDLPPGRGHALPHPQLRDLGPQECRRRLSTHGVGRITVSTPDGRPAVVPVSYEVVDDEIVFRTAPDSVRGGCRNGGCLRGRPRGRGDEPGLECARGRPRERRPRTRHRTWACPTRTHRAMGGRRTRDVGGDPAHAPHGSAHHTGRSVGAHGPPRAAPYQRAANSRGRFR